MITNPTTRKKSLEAIRRDNRISDWWLWGGATALVACGFSVVVTLFALLFTAERGIRLQEFVVILFLSNFPAGLIASRFLRRNVTPIRHMTENALRLASGDRNLRHIRDEALGELGKLARAFNRMIDEIESRQLESREFAERLTTVLGAMSEGVLAIDYDQRILFANRAAGKLLGFDSSHASGKKLVEVARNQLLLDSASEALLQNRIVAKESKRYELDSFPGNTQTLAFRATPISGTPPPGVVIVLLDISELRRLEFLRQEFVANVSHELKTPLTAIKAYAETLLDGALEDRSINRKFLAQIDTEADRLHELIMDLLRLAKIESGHQPFVIERVGMREVAEDSVARFSQSAEAKSIGLSIPPNLPDCFVLADQEGLQQIVDNLVDNAVKYTSVGGTVEISWNCVDRFVSISVRDTGVGIPKESLHRVFERFYRVDKARSRELGSTGLGLAIVKHLVQSFAGTVDVQSDLGSGSTFNVRLPLADEVRTLPRPAATG
jgi:two-component system, OmpR family, phosphate regulon sensor histidine kinase PhoR